MATDLEQLHKIQAMVKIIKDNTDNVLEENQEEILRRLGL